MHFPASRIKIGTLLILVGACLWASLAPRNVRGDNSLDQELRAVLAAHGFTGTVESTIQARLGRPINQKLAAVGHLLYYDPILAIKQDDTCTSCHAPMTGYADTQSIAIGIDSNMLVGPGRAGPRIRRRALSTINAALYPKLTWTAGFESLSGDPFDNSAGFQVPGPDGRTLSYFSHLLAAVACISVTDRTALVGFKFDGDNDAIRATLAARVDGLKRYRRMFAKVYPEVSDGGPITFDMMANAIAEYELTLVYANAPIDQYARGDSTAMSENEKRGALLFFGKARCVECHSVSGQSNEMFSDFAGHVVAVPQLVPENTTAKFDGPNADEDYGIEQVTHDPADRYKFRTTPLRNLGAQRALFHDGAFTEIKSAIEHHLNVFESARNYDPASQHIAKDLLRVGPIEPMLARVDPILVTPVTLTPDELKQLTQFANDGLLDDRAKAENLVREKPAMVPSRMKVTWFEYPDPHDPLGLPCTQCHK